MLNFSYIAGTLVSNFTCKLFIKNNDLAYLIENRSRFDVIYRYAKIGATERVWICDIIIWGGGIICILFW